MNNGSVWTLGAFFELASMKGVESGFEAGFAFF
jgi:hypothetical protein